MESEKIIYLVVSIIFIIVLLFITFFIIYFTFFKKKNQYIKEKKEIEIYLQNEINKTKIEIKDQTLTEVSRELHDNIGQIFSVVKMQLNNLKKSPTINASDLDSIIDNVSNGIEEIRFISKIINKDITLKENLIVAIKNDLERIERLKKIKCSFQSECENLHINVEHELILYRIFQESITNSLKHSESYEIAVTIKNEENFIVIKIIDNGIGLSTKNIDGTGITNMKSRAKLIGAIFSIKSNTKGTEVIVKYPNDKLM